ncbi:hypothetical protein PR048_025702 [Dryococelus australis]|uniref:Integrase catalytic domain-containing protein n=1 Tax=Dryococelus australis TaxID=614101 RepID=A0ABQ9GJB7_9NEOP|nr:hypothetical protein PR048_025702 [Dryococelus australis]
MPHPVPDRPWAYLGIGILEFAGKNFLLLELKLLGVKSSHEVIKKFEEVFANFGSPDLVVSDNVPFSSYEFKQFAECWNFINPHFPQANVLAEKAVDIAKCMLRKVTECKIPLSLASLTTGILLLLELASLQLKCIYNAV